MQCHAFNLCMSHFTLTEGSFLRSFVLRNSKRGPASQVSFLSACLILIILTSCERGRDAWERFKVSRGRCGLQTFLSMVAGSYCDPIHLGTSSEYGMLIFV